MNQQQLDSFIQRYLAMWHEADPARRHELVAELWAEDAENKTGRWAIRGIAEIQARVTRAHDEWVASKGFVFRPAGNTATHNNVVKLFWDMVPSAGGPVESRGLDIFVLDDAGKIAALYQFSEPAR
jgi:hypothetical protein